MKTKTAIIIALCVGGLACAAEAELSDADWNAIHAWLMCYECADGERDSVTAIGQRDADMAVAWLAAALENGPSDESLENMREQFAQHYHRLARYDEAHQLNAPLQSETDYVAGYVNEFRVDYQVRSALALGYIGTPAAASALESARDRHDAGDIVLPEDVLVAIDSAQSWIVP